MEYIYQREDSLQGLHFPDTGAEAISWWTKFVIVVLGKDSWVTEWVTSAKQPRYLRAEF